METLIANPVTEPKQLPASPTVEVEKHLSEAVIQDTPLNYDDDCVICYQTLYRPVKTQCGHAACGSCMLHWALTAMDATPGNSELPPNTGMNVEGIKFMCPTCRTYTEAKFDSELNETLRSKYPDDYAARAVEEGLATGDSEDEFATQTMVIMFGNSHRKVPPSVSPTTGKISEDECTFFVQSSHQDSIELVHVILHPAFRQHRLVTLTQPPFSTTHLTWAYFKVFAGIQLKEGFQWVDAERVVDSDAEKGRVKDRLPIDWLLEFRGNGSQKHLMVKFRKVPVEEKKNEEEEEEDLGELALLMSDAEIKKLREVRKMKAAAKRAQENKES